MQSNLFLLEQISNGNVTAFNLLYKSYWEKLYAFAYRISNGDKEISQQIVQDVFVYIWEKRASLKVSNLDSYLFQATKFQVYTYYNKRKIDTEYLEENFEAYLTEMNFTEDSPIYEILYGAIEKLPEKRKNILLLNKIQGLNIEQIAEQLNISPQTVKNQLGAAIKQLRTELKDVSVLLVLFEFYKTLQ
ncbi:DNA-directed RNA polymerase sigma-70 factor [Neptunitalea chrysea]|uniref:DNA-directed RNA polymerase sigma-70 factor n=1 Tax=Neptunitalea chrysea TaxID=1647581 RepID=A0A9W6B6W0_9FLAO|nr:RNA polymerase sigma-70 factor [Neptunitalea chrysea]GLB53829.1 DNA-directed RNA polymerase sigma-70 factor [Neptunitalea chrysea]